MQWLKVIRTPSSWFAVATFSHNLESVDILKIIHSFTQLKKTFSNGYTHKFRLLRFRAHIFHSNCSTSHTTLVTQEYLHSLHEEQWTELGKHWCPQSLSACVRTAPKDRFHYLLSQFHQLTSWTRCGALTLFRGTTHHNRATVIHDVRSCSNISNDSELGWILFAYLVES